MQPEREDLDAFSRGAAVRPERGLFSFTHQKILNGILIIVTVGYPFLVWFCLDYFQPRVFALGMVALFLLRDLLQPNPLSKRHRFFTPVCVLFMLAVALINQISWLQAYPVFVSLLFFGVFAYSLVIPPSAIERLARLQDPQLSPKGITYTRKVTQVWSVFFLCNAAVSVATIAYGDPWIWSVYNGFIFYLLMGLLMAVEMIIRRKVRASY